DGLPAFAPQRLAVDEAPDVSVETAKLALHFAKTVRVRNGGIDLQPVANYPRVVQQRRDLSFVVTRDFRRIETVERLAIVVTFAQDCFPTQSGLCAFENQKLKQTRVVVNGHAPFLVVIGDR